LFNYEFRAEASPAPRSESIEAFLSEFLLRSFSLYYSISSLSRLYRANFSLILVSFELLIVEDGSGG